MTDTFENLQSGLTAPASQAVAITPDNDDNLVFVTRAIYVGGAGNLSVLMRTGGAVTFNNLPAGTLLPIRVSRVLESSTATNIVGLA